MKNWMYYLARHYESQRNHYPYDKLLILFDIDGTILDMRYTMHCLLKSYDEKYNTRYFDDLRVSDIMFHEDDIVDGLKSLRIPEHAINAIVHWCRENRWSMWSILEANRPFPGVMEVIRWFQLQENTSVGLNSGRSEVLREDTLQSLNSLGREFRVLFHDDLLKMRKSNTGNVAGAKIEAIREFREAGFRVIAMVDNEPAILHAIEQSDVGEDVLLLHASMIFRSQRESKTAGAIQGNVYDLTELIPKRLLPGHIQFVWSHVNTEISLKTFLQSNVMWADVTGVFYNLLNKKTDPATRLSIARDSSLLLEYIGVFKDNQRGMRVNLQPGEDRLEIILDELVDSGMEDHLLWLSGNVDANRKDTFRLISDIFPNAIIECPVDFIVPVLSSTPDKAEQILDTYTMWGINRFALSWKTPNARQALSTLEGLGFETTVYDVKSLEEFLQSVLHTPAAIVSDFNFPLWNSRDFENSRYPFPASVNA